MWNLILGAMLIIIIFYVAGFLLQIIGAVIVLIVSSVIGLFEKIVSIIKKK